jgi:hypothetical protein
VWACGGSFEADFAMSRRSNAWFQRLLERGSRTTYRGKIRKRAGQRTASTISRGKQRKYKGVDIIPVGSGEYTLSIDRDSRFESVRDAKRVIDHMQRNPRGRGLLPGSQKRYLTKAIKTLERKQDKQDYGSSEWLRLNKLIGDYVHRLEDLKDTERGNPMRSKGTFQRCVEAVSKRGGAYDPQAVCAAQERKKYGQKELTKRAKAGKRAKTRRRNASDWKVEKTKARGFRPAGWSVVNTFTYETYGTYPTKAEALRVLKTISEQIQNPADAAMAVSEEFHGRKVKAMIPVQEKRHHHKYLAELGELRKLVVVARDGRHKVTMTKFDGAILATNEDKNQLFIVGGDQSVPLSDFGIRNPHEKETLGEVVKIEYFTDKEHLGSEGGEAVYVHKFKKPPDLTYYLRDQHLEFAGGSYVVKAEGIDK